MVKIIQAEKLNWQQVNLKHWSTVLVGLAVMVGGVACSTVAAQAVPAAPTSQTLRQADGTTFQVKLRGDEFFHWYETLDGRPVLSNADGVWVYATAAAGGGLTPTTRVVGNGPQTMGLPFRPAPPAGTQTARAQRDQENASFAERRRGGNALGGTTEGLSVPTTGTGNVPVILVTFSDTTATYTTSQFNTMLFGTSGRTMRTYYTEVSGGKFTVSAGPGGVVGWYKAAHPHDYYGANVSGSDAHATDLVREAVAAADRAGFNFAPYDQDGDGDVDAVCIVHQGEGEEVAGNPSTNIWSHQWDLQWDGGKYQTNDGVKVGRYIMQPEKLFGRMITPGVFCHEYGHALGLPDLYDIDYSSEGIGNYSLMAAGEWAGATGDGSTPTHMDAWCKLQLGWAKVTTLTATRLGAQILTAASSNAVFKLPAGGSTTEYYLVENRQRTGFDTYLPAAGLGIYHVDDALTESNENEWYPGHVSSGHYRVAIEQADGRFDLERTVGQNRGDSGDLYSSSSTVKTFSATTTPNNKLYSGTAAGFSVNNISAAASIMTADFVFTTPPAVYSLRGTVKATPTTGVSGVKGITVLAVRTSDNTRFTTTTDTSGNYVFTGLTAGTYNVAPQTAGFIYTYTPVTRTQTQPVQLTASASSATGLDFVAKRIITGRVYNVWGVSGDTGVSGITIKAVRQGDNATVTVMTSMTGAYTLNLDPGTWYFTAVRSSDTTFRFGALFTNPAGITATAPAPTTAYNFSATGLMGRIVTSAGVVVANVQGGLYAATDTALRTPLRTIASNAKGIFGFGGLAAGRYILAPVPVAGVTYTPASRAGTLANTTLNLGNFIKAAATRTAATSSTSSAGTATTSTRSVPGGETSSGEVPGGTVSVGDTGNQPETPRSNVTLSTTAVDMRSGLIRLVFAGTLDNESASDASHYAVVINDEPAEVEAVQVQGGNTVILLLSPEDVQSRGVAQISWSGLRDTRGRALDGTTRITFP